MTMNNAKPAMNLQDSFLNHVRKENLGVIIYLVNGFQIRGLVRGFYRYYRKRRQAAACL